MATSDEVTNMTTVQGVLFSISINVFYKTWLKLVANNTNRPIGPRVCCSQPHLKEKKIKDQKNRALSS